MPFIKSDNKTDVINRQFNPFLVNIPTLYPLEIPENLWFSGVFMVYKMGTLLEMVYKVNK